MTLRDEDELRSLRERAYGKNPDIHLDEDAMRRLRELERKQTAGIRRGVHDLDTAHVDHLDPVAVPGSAVGVADDRVETEVAVAAAAAVEYEDVEPEPIALRAARGLRVAGIAVVRSATRLRRSTVLIAVGSGLVVATLVTALVLVQRVQVDPLQVGAEQVARLSVDRGYELPSLFTGAAEIDSDAHAFEEFYGLRAVAGLTSFFGSDSGEKCLALYPAAIITGPDQENFSGPIFSGCAAGVFPAVIQIGSNLDGMPAELAQAFPDGTGLQFVYDADTDEVVVFVG